MKIFLDTNVFLDYFEKRGQYGAVSKIFDAVEDGHFEAVISTGCAYTLCYLIRMGLKRSGVYRPEQTERLRDIMNGVLDLVSVQDLDHDEISSAINNPQFDDLEDSLQHQCAVVHNCDVLITVNTRDFNCDDIQVLSPDSFLEIHGVNISNRK